MEYHLFCDITKVGAFKIFMLLYLFIFVFCGTYTVFGRSRSVFSGTKMEAFDRRNELVFRDLYFELSLRDSHDDHSIILNCKFFPLGGPFFFFIWWGHAKFSFFKQGFLIENLTYLFSKFINFVSLLVSSERFLFTFLAFNFLKLLRSDENGENKGDLASSSSSSFLPFFLSNIFS